jgi:hypothetical protein
VAEGVSVLSPTCVRAIGYLYEGLDEASVREDFAALVERLQGAILDQQAHVIFARAPGDETYEIYLKVILEHDYCLAQVWATPIQDDLWESFQRATAHCAQVPRLVSAEPLFEVQILTCQEPVAEQEVSALFSRGVPARSLIYARRLQVDRCGDRYTLFPIGEGVPDWLISDAVDDVAHLEMYYRKILSFHAVYPQVYQQVSRIEDLVSARMEEATRSPMIDWLNEVSDRYVDLSNITRALTQDSYSITANLNNLEATARRWGERKAGDYLSVSETMVAEARLVLRAHTTLSFRVDEIRERLNDVITMVRTRSEVNRLRVTSFIQFVTTAFGMSGIASQVFESLQDLDWLPASISPRVMTLLFIPVAIAIAWGFTQWMSRRR